MSTNSTAWGTFTTMVATVKKGPGKTGNVSALPSRSTTATTSARRACPAKAAGSVPPLGAGRNPRGSKGPAARAVALTFRQSWIARVRTLIQCGTPPLPCLALPVLPGGELPRSRGCCGRLRCPPPVRYRRPRWSTSGTHSGSISCSAGLEVSARTGSGVRRSPTVTEIVGTRRHRSRLC